MFVFDTSAFINGWNDHYPPPTFERVWTFLATQMEDGRLVAPRAVLIEIERRTDALAEWAKGRPFTDPSPEVQRRVGELQVDHPGVFGPFRFYWGDRVRITGVGGRVAGQLTPPACSRIRRP
jgi:hypothetical protein